MCQTHVGKIKVETGNNLKVNIGQIKLVVVWRPSCSLYMIIYTDIVGDLLHHGHVNLMKRCKEMGDFLIVGVCSDKVVESYKRAPILNVTERAKMVEAIKYVDEVIESPPTPITIDFMLEHKIDLVVRAGDMSDSDNMYWYGVPILQKKFKTIPYTVGISTTEIIGRITNSDKN